MQNEQQAEYLTPKLADNIKIRGEGSEGGDQVAACLAGALVPAADSQDFLLSDSRRMCKRWMGLQEGATGVPGAAVAAMLQSGEGFPPPRNI